MESVKIKENFRQVQLKAEEIKLFNESFVIVPYQVSGFVDFSNRGNVSYTSNPNNYETFKRVWTGNDACVINWKNSLKITQDPVTKKGIYNYKLGEVFLGLMETNSFSNDISKDVAFSEYTSQQQVNTLTFRVDKMFRITDYYNFMFYKIPEMSGSTLYRIENIEKDYVGRTLIGYVITFKSINQELANTGRAKQQNIMPCAPGQGYLECIVYQSKEEFINRIGKDKFNSLIPGKDYYELFGRYITGDWEKTKNRPIHKMEIKFHGPAIINSICLLARPAISNEKFISYEPQRLAFPFEFEEPQLPTLYRSQNNNNNYSFSKFELDISQWMDWKEKITSIWNDNQKWKYEGFVNLDRQLFNSSNPLEGHKYKFDLYGRVADSTENYLKAPWDIEFFPDKGAVTTQGNYGTKEEYNIGSIECLKSNGEREVKNKTIDTIMFDNYWITRQMKTLPISDRNTLTFGVVGSLFMSFLEFWNPALQLFSIGLPSNKISKSRAGKVPPFYGIINSSWAQAQINVTTKDAILSSSFEDGTTSPSSLFYNNSSIQTSFRSKLTNKILYYDCNAGSNYREIDTLEIGSNKNNLLDGKWLLTEGAGYDYETKTHNGYIIDGIKICSFGKVDIEINFLDEYDEVVWTGIYQSQSKWTDSLKEIWTEINTSVLGRESIYFKEPLEGIKPPEQAGVYYPPSKRFPIGIRKEGDWETKLKPCIDFSLIKDVHACLVANKDIDAISDPYQYLLTSKDNQKILFYDVDEETFFGKYKKCYIETRLFVKNGTGDDPKIIRKTLDFDLNKVRWAGEDTTIWVRATETEQKGSCGYWFYWDLWAKLRILISLKFLLTFDRERKTIGLYFVNGYNEKPIIFETITTEEPKGYAMTPCAKPFPVYDGIEYSVFAEINYIAFEE